MFFLKPKIIGLCLLLMFNSFVNAKGANLNFNNVDIRKVIEAVSKATGKNFLVDPRVSGQVTLVSSSDMDAKELYGVFLSILRIHGFIATEINNGIIKIVPNSEIRSEANIERPSAGLAGDGVIMDIIPIANTKATALIPILRPMISRNGHIVAHDDSNNILVSDTRSNIQKLKDVIAKIDNANKSKLHILPIINADATSLVKTINAMFNKSKDKDKPQVSSEKRTNSLLIRGSESKFNEIKKIVAQLDISQSANGSIAVIKINHSKAKNISEVITKIIKTNKNKNSISDVALIKDEVQIAVDEKSNSIVTVGSTESIRTVRNIIKKLDTKRKQVLVEVIIVEVNVEKDQQIGLQWGKSLLVNSAAFAKKAVEAGKTTTSSTSKSNNTTTTETTEYAIGAMDAFNFSVLTEMLGVKSDANANLLSTPSILTIENEKATIEVGQEVPFLKGTGSSDGNTFQKIERKDVGIKLHITPQINDEDIVRLEIDQEISGVLPGAKAQSDASDIVTSKRSIKTNVLVKNGNILVLGGLIDDHVIENKRPTVFFSSIPVFGQPFRQRATSKSKRNLMMFIRPTIIDDDYAGNRVTLDRYQHIRGLQLEKQKKGVDLMPGEDQPMLSEIPNNP